MSTLAASVPTAAISLYFREGSSDKVYHAQIVPNGDDLYAVNFQYGRRGSTLQTGAKTAVPVALADARKIFNKLVTEKKAKGYTEGERGVPYSSGELANRRFEYTPQLLNFIDEPAMLEYLRRPDWFMQEKIDGVRQIVECRAGVVTAGNRNGLTVAVSAAIVEAVLALSHDCVLDGEATGDVYWPFDLLSFDGRELRYAAPFFGGTPFGLRGRSLPAPLPGCAHNQACVAALVRIVENTQATFSAVQLRFLLAALVTLNPEFIEALASEIVGDDEDNQQKPDEVCFRPSRRYRTTSWSASVLHAAREH